MGLRSEFHDMAEAELLNGESGGATAWGNLGDWSRAHSYPAACAALAIRLGKAAGLGAETSVLDVGFGCGDQLLLWQQRFGVRQIVGINLSQSQTRFAQRRLSKSHLPERTIQLHQGDVAAGLRDIVANTPPQVVIALDCAYHFADRAAFIRDAASVLPVGGRIALADLHLGPGARGWGVRAGVLGIGALCRIPRRNRVDAAGYRAQLEAAGFEVRHWIDLSDQVFSPFAAWLQRYLASAQAPQVPAQRWRKYRVTARMLRWVAAHDALRYVVCVAERTR